MIALRRIDHVALGVADVVEASERWSAQFGLAVRSLDRDRALLACDDEPYSLELIQSEVPGHLHTAFELTRDCSLADAQRHLSSLVISVEEGADTLTVTDPDGRGVELVPYRPSDRLVAHARRSTLVRPGAPRRLGHVNCLTADLGTASSFYIDALGMKLTDRLGTQGGWFHIGSEHHVMALIEVGRSHFHHFAFDVVDVGQMRDLLDRIARHGRWLGWGPVRHGVGGNIASYVRIVEEACFCELYCDMEQLDPDHEPRVYPDDRFSSNTWGALPPRSYFRFDQAAIESERESLETLGVPLEQVADAA